MHAATSNSSLPFKYTQNCLFGKPHEIKEPSDLFQGSPWAVREQLCGDPHAPWASPRERAWLPHHQGGRLGGASCSWIEVMLKGILPSLPGSWQNPCLSMSCPLCLTHTWSCLDCDSSDVRFGGGTLHVLVW